MTASIRGPTPSFTTGARQNPVIVLHDDMTCQDSCKAFGANNFAKLQEQQLRSQALQPFMMPPPTRGVVGTSRFAQRMKAQVMQAAKDPLRCVPSHTCLCPCHCSYIFSCCCCAGCIAAATDPVAALVSAALLLLLHQKMLMMMRRIRAM